MELMDLNLPLDFYLSHPKMKFPTDGHIYSINEGNYVHFSKRNIKYCQFEEGDRPYTSGT
jgi:fructose-1,6-bisphosphatase I